MKRNLTPLRRRVPRVGRAFCLPERVGQPVPRRRHTSRLFVERLETRLAPANVDVLSYHIDPFLSGQNLQEEGLTLANVNATNFGRLFSQTVDGPLYAQPLYRASLMIGGGPHNVAFVATEHDSVYAFDLVDNPVTGLTVNPLWRTSFIDPVHGISTIPAAELGNPDIVPEIGITGTPVIDASSDTLYVVPRTKEVRGTVVHYVSKLYALDITTGAVKFGGPYIIGDTTRGGPDGGPPPEGWTNTTSIVVPGRGDGSGPDGNVRFNAGRQMQRPALALAGGVVYVAWASQADFRPYHGWVIGFNATTLQPVRWINTSPNAGGNGIWQSGGGISADPQGNLYFANGNGFDGPNLAFDPANGNYSESVVKICTTVTTQCPTLPPNRLPVADYFTPFEWRDLDIQDADLGSGGVMLLPDFVGSAAHPRLMVETGKSAKIYLMDRDNMGGNVPPPGPDRVVQVARLGPVGVWGNPTFFKVNATTGIVYYHGSGDFFKGFYISNGHLEDGSLPGDRPILRSNIFASFPGTQPVVSANGIANPTSPTNGIVWELQVDAGGLGQIPNQPAVLRAFNATNLAAELYDSSQTGQRDQPDPGNKFTSLAVSNGRVLIGTRGTFSVFGLFPTATAVPPPRSNLTALLQSGPQGPQIQLSWTNPTPTLGAAPTGIKILRSTDGTNFTLYNTVARDQATFTDVGPFDIGQRYYYRVAATNQLGDSALTDPVSVLVPIASSVLTVTGASAASVGLSWTSVVNDHYSIERSTGGGAFSPVATVPAFQTTYFDRGLTPGIYAYRIHAFNVGPTADSLSNVQGASVGAVIDHSASFANPADLTANGNALFAETTARLTNSRTQTGSVFSNTRITTARFSTTFQARLHEGTQPNYADGFTFVLQANGPTALGQGTSGLGYQGIGRSVAVKFSTFQHPGDPSSSTTGLVVNGADPGGGVTTGDVLLNSQDQKEITLTYDGTTLTERIVDIPRPELTFSTSFTVNIPQVIGSDTAYVGFTGATGSGSVEGGYWQVQDIVNWTFAGQAPLPGAPSSVRVASSASSEIDLAWNANSYNEAGFRIERSTDGTYFSEIGTSAATTFNDLGLGNGTYLYRVRAFNAAGNSPYSNTFQTGLPGQILVQDQDVGTPGDPALPGSASFAANGVYTVSASGHDIWDQSDGFHFAYKPLIGDGQVIARVMTVGNTDFWAKAGVMIRDTLAGNSRDAYVTMTPHNQVQFLRRLATGANAEGDGPGGVPLPIWVRVQRQGNTFTGFWSPNGSTWNQIQGPVTITMGPVAYVGLVASSHNNGAVSTSTFDSVQVLPGVLQTSHVDVSAAFAFVTPGTPLNITVDALDPCNNLVPGYRGMVQFTSSDQMAGLPADFMFTEADGGRHTFQVTLRTLGRQTVTVTDRGMNGITGATAVTVANQVLGSLQVAGFPSPATVGMESTFTVTARDRDGHTFPGYRGTVHFTSSDPRAQLPGDYMYTAADSGVHTFRATLNSLGTQSITATDPVAQISGSQTVVVNPPAVITVDHSAGFAANSDLQANGAARFVPNADPVGMFLGHQDIGNVGQAGSATFANGVYTVRGSGADIWDVADGFQFVYKPLIGDGEIVARLTSTQFTDFFSKAGVMIRETLEANSPHALMFVFPPGHDAAEFGRRVVRAQQSFADTVNISVRPQWVRLARSGSTFSAFRSDNGTSWIQVGPTTTINMASTAFIGLAVTAHNNGVLNTATFDNVTITGNTGPLPPPVARLTDGAFDEAGSLFTRQIVPFANFTTTFTFQDRPAVGIGDGLTFILQGNGPTALGRNGADMGSAGIARSVAIKFDFWSRGSHRSTTGLYLDGQSPSDPANPGLDMTPAGIDLSSNHPFAVTLGYDGITLSESIIDTVTRAAFSTAYDVNLSEHLGGNGGYVGFTGGTGGDTVVQDIQTWTGRFLLNSPTGSFSVTSFPSPARAGVQGSFTVTARDANGNVNPGYRGTVHFTSGDLRAVLPADYTFTAADNGVHTFQAILNSAGTQALTATDRTNRITGSQVGIVVNPAPALTRVGRAFVINEGDTLAVNGAFADPVAGQAHTVAVAWGDGSADTTLPLAPGVFAFSTGHRYTEERNWTIRINVASADGGNDTVTLPASAAAVAPPSGLVSWWTGDGNNPSTVPDSAGSNAGTLVNGATYAPGKVGNAFSFNGINQYVDLPMATNIPVDNGTYTLMAWINPNTAGDEGIIGYGNYGSANQVNALRLLNVGGNRLAFRHYWWANDLDVATNLPATGAWHLVAATFDGTLRRIVLDGQIIAEDRPAGHNVPSAANLRIGSTNFGEFFNGLIDEAQVYSRALTQPEIQAIFNVGSAGQVKGVRALDPPAGVTGGFNIAAVAGVPSRMQTVATFTDPGGAEPLNDYSATINWGDNTSSAGVISGPLGGVFTVQGSHNYATADSYRITVTIRHDGAPDAVGTSMANVSTLVIHFLVSGFPSPSVAGAPGSFTVTALDQLDEMVAAYRGSVTFHSSDPQALLPGNYTFTATDNGAHNFSATLLTAGTQSITVTDVAMSTITGTQAGILVQPANATALTLSGFPSPVLSGMPASVTVTAVDRFGNPGAVYTGTVHFTSSDPGALLAPDYTFTAADRGQHTFFPISLVTVGNQSLSAADRENGFTATQDVLVLPARFIVTGFPSPTRAGDAGTFTVTVVDGAGRVVTGYTGTVHFSSSDAQATLPLDYTFNPDDQGRHVFGAVVRTAGMQSIAATDTGFDALSGAQSGIVVTPSQVAGYFVVTGFPSPIRAGTPGSFTVTVYDPYGNVATGYTGTVTFASSDPQADLPPDYTFMAGEGGMHTFTATLKTAGAQLIALADTNNGASGEQDNIQVTPGDAVSLLVFGYPSPVRAGTLNLFTVTAVDAYGNRGAVYLGTVHFSSSDILANLPVDFTFTTADNGTHVFAAVFNTSGSQSLTATDTADPSITGTQDDIEVVAETGALSGGGEVSGQLSVVRSPNSWADLRTSDHAPLITDYGQRTTEGRDAWFLHSNREGRWKESVSFQALSLVLSDWHGSLPYGLVDELVRALSV